MDSVVNAYLKDFKITEITLLSDSTLNTKTNILDQSFAETGSYFIENNQIFDKESGRLFATITLSYDELSVCHTFTLESGRLNNGQKFTQYKWDFCKSTDTDKTAQDLSLQSGRTLDTLMLYFVDMKYRR